MASHLSGAARKLFEECVPDRLTASSGESEEETLNRYASSFLHVCELEGIALPARAEVLAEIGLRSSPPRAGGE